MELPAAALDKGGYQIVGFPNGISVESHVRRSPMAGTAACHLERNNQVIDPAAYSAYPDASLVSHLTGPLIFRLYRVADRQLPWGRCASAARTTFKNSSRQGLRLSIASLDQVRALASNLVQAFLVVGLGPSGSVAMCPSAAITYYDTEVSENGRLRDFTSPHTSTSKVVAGASGLTRIWCATCVLGM